MLMRSGLIVGTALGFVLACSGRVTSDTSLTGGTAGTATGANGGTVSSGGTGGSPIAGGTGGSSGCSGDLLSNPEHCGYCGHTCLGGSCMDGKCQTVVLQYLGTTGATALAVDAEQVWWAAPIQHMNKDGSDWQTMVKTNDDVSGLALDDANVYWSSPSFGVWTLPKVGASSPGFPIFPEGYGVAVDATHVYTVWQGVFKRPKGGGPITVLAKAGDRGIALDDDWVYFTTWSPGGAFRVNKNGGPSEALGESDYASDCAVHGNRVYWTSQGSPGAVYSAPKSGGAQETLVSGAATPYGIAADDRGVYFAELDAGKIWMLPADGSPAIELASGQFSPRDVAIDELAVYWTNDASQSAVSKVAKP